MTMTPDTSFHLEELENNGENYTFQSFFPILNGFQNATFEIQAVRVDSNYYQVELNQSEMASNGFSTSYVILSDEDNSPPQLHYFEVVSPV